MKQPIMTEKRALELRRQASQDLEYAKLVNDSECIRIHRERIAKLDRIIDYYCPDTPLIVGG